MYNVLERPMHWFVFSTKSPHTHRPLIPPPPAPLHSTHRETEGAGEEWTCAFCAAVNVGRFDWGERVSSRRTLTDLYVSGWDGAIATSSIVHTPTTHHDIPHARTPTPQGARGGGKLPPEFERQAVEFQGPLPGRRRRGRTLAGGLGGLGAWAVFVY